ncbi:programmed cell death 1 ligand 1 isoform X2 [Sorex fumeus]|uniref:programmed cell death 1 ligand 1 isoform X2 n=1 Tax=Sorex fumeus TaxID=62283 RepID=UPI0024AD2E9F|nr:programmed cell death 1 ligand 1 isoform X2 [Sorex fumeus]
MNTGHSREMITFSIFILVAYCHTLKAFTVTVTKDLYIVEYGSNVTIECKFPIKERLNMLSLIVYWEMDGKKITQFMNGKEDMTVQHSNYRQRAHLLKDQLFLGKAALQITEVKMQDAGVYCCLISYGGADYKRITLKVYAPYREINQQISRDPVTSEYELMCQAEGYPEAEVFWTSSDHRVLSGETTITSSKREEKLLNVTSILRINATANDIFYCTFRSSPDEENRTAELVIPEPLVILEHQRARWICLGAVVLLLVAMAIICLKTNVRMTDVENCCNPDVNSKTQNDTQFEET